MGPSKRWGTQGLAYTATTARYARPAHACRTADVEPARHWCLHTPAVQQTLNHRAIGAITANASVASLQTSITLTDAGRPCLGA